MCEWRFALTIEVPLLGSMAQQDHGTLENSGGSLYISWHLLRQPPIVSAGMHINKTNKTSRLLLQLADDLVITVSTFLSFVFLLRQLGLKLCLIGSQAAVATAGQHTRPLLNLLRVLMSHKASPVGHFQIVLSSARKHYSPLTNFTGSCDQMIELMAWSLEQKVNSSSLVT